LALPLPTAGSYFDASPQVQDWLTVSLQQISFRGFANPVDPTPAELRAWAYHPEMVTLQNMPPDWDLLVASDRLVGTLLDLALDANCPARRFALHCLYIYAADSIRTKLRAHPKRRLRKLVEQAEEAGDDPVVGRTPGCCAAGLFDYRDWCEGGLVRAPRRLKAPAVIPAPRPAAPGTIPASSRLPSLRIGEAGPPEGPGRSAYRRRKSNPVWPDFDGRTYLGPLLVELVVLPRHVLARRSCRSSCRRSSDLLVGG
jgi:hypothetical protein